MKIILLIFCGLIALFAGGCALLLFASGNSGEFAIAAPLALIPGGVAVLNILAIAALVGKSPPQRWALYTLVVLDAAVVLTTLGLWIAAGTQESALNLLAIAIGGAFALKGLLTLQLARNGTLGTRE